MVAHLSSIDIESPAEIPWLTVSGLRSVPRLLYGGGMKTIPRQGQHNGFYQDIIAGKTGKT